jgi:hypothetical protein
VITRQIWGHGEYTADSDIVAILQHSGSFLLPPAPPSDYVALRVYLRVGPTKTEFVASLSGGIQSRRWPQPGISISIDRAEPILGSEKQLPFSFPLVPCLTSLSSLSDGPIFSYTT